MCPLSTFPIANYSFSVISNDTVCFGITIRMTGNSQSQYINWIKEATTTLVLLKDKTVRTLGFGKFILGEQCNPTPNQYMGNLMKNNSRKRYERFA